MLGIYVSIGYLSTQLHELGHWAMGISVGNPIILGFNRWLIDGSSDSAQSIGILAAGPLVTLMLIVIGFVVARFAHQSLTRWVGMSLVLFNSWFALVPQMTSLLFGGMGDEGWIAYYLGIPQFVIRVPLVIVLVTALLVMLRLSMQEISPNNWALVGLFVIPLIITGLIVLLDRMVWLSYEDGTIFAPIAGISAVTVILNALLFAVVLIILWREIN